MQDVYSKKEALKLITKLNSEIQSLREQRLEINKNILIKRNKVLHLKKEDVNQYKAF